MGASKTAHFSDRQNQMASIAKAMGHPARIAILEFLTRTDACICGDIVNVLPLSQPTVSQHLKELKDVGLIQGSVEGASICYCVNQKTLTLLKDYIDSMFDSKKCC